MARRSHFAILSIILATSCLSLPAMSQPTHQSGAHETDAEAVAVGEASMRFKLPLDLIRAVIAAESAWNARIISTAGAMGLMQIMPATWKDMRLRYGLGTDPFRPRDNIIAGSAYLRALLDRYGTNGFLAAYNAGPEQYENYLATGHPLPRETQAYIKRVSANAQFAIGNQGDALQKDGGAWAASKLFVRVANTRPSTAVEQDEPELDVALTPYQEIFVPLSSASRTP